jgi:hypothetical protein
MAKATACRDRPIGRTGILDIAEYSCGGPIVAESQA